MEVRLLQGSAQAEKGGCVRAGGMAGAALLQHLSSSYKHRDVHEPPAQPSAAPGALCAFPHSPSFGPELMQLSKHVNPRLFMPGWPTNCAYLFYLAMLNMDLIAR